MVTNRHDYMVAYIQNRGERDPEWYAAHKAYKKTCSRACMQRLREKRETERIEAGIPKNPVGRPRTRPMPSEDVPKRPVGRPRKPKPEVQVQQPIEKPKKPEPLPKRPVGRPRKSATLAAWLQAQSLAPQEDPPKTI